MSETIAIDDLQVGMYIHLDGGWMSHPFARSSFRVRSEAEIARIRELGVARLRWSRERSLLVDASSEAMQTPDAPGAGGEDAAPCATAGARDPLADQRAAMRRCQAQFDEASTALRQVIGSVREHPQAARDGAQALTDGLVARLQPESEMRVLVLGGQAGERATTHALNVTVMSLLMGRVFGFGNSEMVELGMGALLHDVGKLDLPQRLHHHDDRFTQAELSAYRDHVRLGGALGRRMGLVPAVLEVIEQHHEHADGTGYPARLIMDRMSTPARIVSMVNRFDNLCNPRASGRAMTPHEALSRLFAQSKGKFDATMLTAFIRMMGVYPAGSVVQLTDDRYALVTHVNATRPLKPHVLTHEPGVPRDQALLINLAEMPDLGIRRSVGVSQLPDEAREYLRPSVRVAYFFEPAPQPKELAWV